MNDWTHRTEDAAAVPIATRLASILNEAVMGFLALVALATALGPMVFDVSTEVELVLSGIEWLLVAAFAAEFVVQGLVVDDRRAWMRSGWRIVDLITILGPLAALLPQVSDVARGSLMFRALRLGRAVAFGTRAGTVVARRGSMRTAVEFDKTPVISVVSGDGDGSTASADWPSCLAWSSAPGAAWFHAANLDRRNFVELADAARVSSRDIEQALSEDGHARVRQDGQRTTMVLQVPEVESAGFPAVRRSRLLVVVDVSGVLTAMTGTLDLQAPVVAFGRTLPALPFPARVVCALLAVVRERNSAMLQRFDEEVRRFEALDSGEMLLQDTFRLRREISAAVLDLWHLKALVRSLADGKVHVRGIDLTEEKFLDDLLAESESLYEGVSRTKDDLQGLIELHINVKSFEMNKFLKLLAVVSFLGLIPSVVGGLLGMNVADNPWSVTLGQVAFGVAMGMATSLYVFAMKGWLK